MPPAPLRRWCSGEDSSLELLPHNQQSCLKKRHFYPSSPDFYSAQGPEQSELHSEPQPSRVVLGSGGFRAQGCSCPLTHRRCKEAASPLPPSAILRRNNPANKTESATRQCFYLLHLQIHHGLEDVRDQQRDAGDEQCHRQDPHGDQTQRLHGCCRRCRAGSAGAPPGSGSGGGRTAGPARQRREQPPLPALGAAAAAARPGMLCRPGGCCPRDALPAHRGRDNVSQRNGAGSCPQGLLAQPEGSCPLGMVRLERPARCGGQRQRALCKISGAIPQRDYCGKAEALHAPFRLN